MQTVVNLEYVSLGRGPSTCKAGVPNLWPAGQKWPPKPQNVAQDLSKNEKNNISDSEKLQKLTVLQDIGLLKNVTICYCKLYCFEIYK